MSEKLVKALVDGGKANAGPPIGPTLAPMGVNITEVVKEINEKTASFEGMSVPVNIIVDTSSKTFRIEVGTPPVSALIKKAIGAKKASGKAAEHKVGDIAIDQIIAIALSKKDVMHAKTPQKAVKEAVGTCVTMGVLVEGKDPREVQKEVTEGKYDDKILGKTPLKEYAQQEIMERNKAYHEASAAREKAKKDEPVVVPGKKKVEEEEKPEEKKEEPAKKGKGGKKKK